MIKFRKMCREKSPVQIVDWLSAHTEVSKVKIKKTIDLGGLWVTTGKKRKRIKKIKTEIKSGQFIEFFHNPELDVENTEAPVEITRGRGFGIWFKPASQPVSETPFSDKGCLTWYVKQKYQKVYLINRLDFEVSGLVLVAYDKNIAAKLNELQNESKLKKFYLAEVLGEVESGGEIDIELDGKPCLTTYEIHSHYEGNTRLDIRLHTGRFHQIRKHFNMIKHPIIGDPKYGKGNKADIGLQLQAYKLFLGSPFKLECEIPDELKIF